MIDVLRYLGRKWDPAFNCWDFVRLVYKDSFGLELDPHAINRPEDLRGAAHAVSLEIRNPVWEEISAPEANAVVLLGKGGVRWHAGVCVTPGNVAHLIDIGGVIVQSPLDISRAFTSTTYFRHAYFRSRPKAP